MSRRFRHLALGLATLLWLAGCSTYITEQRPAWRAEAENACLARNVVQESVFVQASHEFNGPGICGLTHPFKVTALADGTVTMNSTATLGCPMVAALDSWIKEVVQPAAQARFGEPVVRINSMGSYSCRGINNMSGAKLSEHSFGNAIDVGGFVLASGRELNVMRGFNGADEQERAFLHEAHAGACGHFTTVLGPGYNIFHYNHFHLDLAMHGSTSRGSRRYCKPVPQKALPEAPKRDNLPDPPPIEEEMDIARAPAPASSMTLGSPRIVASVPLSASDTRAAAYAPTPHRRAGFGTRGPDPLQTPTMSAPSIVTFADPGIDPAPDRGHPRIARAPESISPRPGFEARPAAPEAEMGNSPAEPGTRDDATLPATGSIPDGEGGPSALDATPAGPATAPNARAPIPPDAPTEGAPAEWDVTSSIR